MSEKKPPAATPPHPAPSFSEFVTDLDHGRIDQLLTERLAEVVKAVEETGKVGELVFRLAVKLEGKMAVVGAEIKSKVPEHPLHGTLFYVGGNGELLRDDPRQQTMKGLEPPRMRSVSFPISEIDAPSAASFAPVEED